MKSDRDLVIQTARSEVTSSVPAMIHQLSELLSYRLLAVFCHVGSSGLLKEWEREALKPSREQEDALYVLYAIVTRLRQMEANQTIKAYLLGTLGEYIQDWDFVEANATCYRILTNGFS